MNIRRIFAAACLIAGMLSASFVSAGEASLPAPFEPGDVFEILPARVAAHLLEKDEVRVRDLEHPGELVQHQTGRAGGDGPRLVEEVSTAPHRGHDRDRA